METGRIYVLKSNQTEQLYVGSTISTIKVRFIKHKVDYKRYLKDNKKYMSSFELIKYNDCYIELIKEVYCLKSQLLELENEEIKRTHNCVNINNAFLSKEELLKYHQQHHKQYAENHRAELLLYMKTRRESKKEMFKEYEQRRNNKEERLSNGRTKILCECGTLHNKACKARHLRGLLHQKYLSSL